MAIRQATLGLIKTTIAAGLTFIAGYTDVVGWLSLNRVFTAQMSGNLVLLGVHVAAGDRQAWLQIDAIAAFLAGLVITGGVIEIGMRARMPRIFVVALLVEFLMLGVFTAMGGELPARTDGQIITTDWQSYVLVGVLAFAMGGQNTSLRMAGILSTFTTHMTGVLTSFSEEIIVCLFSLFQAARRRRHGGFTTESLRARHATAFKNIGASAMLLVGFFAGALLGALLWQSAGLRPAMAVPLALLCGIAAVDLVIPLTIFPQPAKAG
ncbi:MAG TPA: YoaK family protein [Stellaceae bacterium]|nr:YoaK family protein [Stellaceae bacterium]